MERHQRATARHSRSKKSIRNFVRQYLGSGKDPDEGDEDAPEGVGPDEAFTNDPDRVSTNFYFLDRFGLPPDVTERQEESMMEDIMKMDKEKNYQQWCHRHDVEIEEDLFADAPSLYDALGRR